MKWLKVYGLPKLPLFLARWAMRLGLPGPTWYKWKAASAGTGVILDEMIRAADDLGYDGQKIGKLGMTRIGEKQGRDLREQLGVKTMKDTVDVVMLANRFFGKNEPEMRQDYGLQVSSSPEARSLMPSPATTLSRFLAVGSRGARKGG